MPSLISDCDRLRDMLDFNTSSLSSVSLWERACRKSVSEGNIGPRLSVGHWAHVGPDCSLHLTSDQWREAENLRDSGSSVFCPQAASPHKEERSRVKSWVRALHLLPGDHPKLLSSFDGRDSETSSSFFFPSAQTSIMLSIFKTWFPSLIWK